MDIKPLLTLSVYGKVYLLLSFVQLVVVSALEAVVAAYCIPLFDLTIVEYRSIIVYFFIFIFSQIFQFYVLGDALWQQNTIQIFGHVLFNLSMSFYAVFQLSQMENVFEQATAGTTDPLGGCPESSQSASSSNATSHINNFKGDYDDVMPYIAATVALLFFFSITFGLFAFKLYLEFGWKIYKKIGADPKMRSMYRAYQIFIMMLKFDFYFFFAFAVQFMLLVSIKRCDGKLDINYELWTTLVLILIIIVVIPVIVWGLRHENIWITLSWMVLLLLGIAYFLFKIIRIYQPDQSYKYVGSGKFLTFFATIGLVMIILTFINTVVCFRNFGKNLKPHLVGEKGPGQSEMQEQSPTTAPATGGAGTMTLLMD